jgi:hypothetical protein
MARDQKVIAIMVRDQKTRLHRWGGIFTQKQKVWDGLVSLGITPDTEIFYGDENKVKMATKDRLQDALRDVEFGDMITLRAPDDDKWVILSQVVVNELYKSTGEEDDDE